MCLIALIDDATNRWWGRFVTSNSREENMRMQGEWLQQ
jgi:hypothetical protein